MVLATGYRDKGRSQLRYKDVRLGHDDPQNGNQLVDNGAA